MIRSTPAGPGDNARSAPIHPAIARKNKRAIGDPGVQDIAGSDGNRRDIDPKTRLTLRISAETPAARIGDLEPARHASRSPGLPDNFGAAGDNADRVVRQPGQKNALHRQVRKRVVQSGPRFAAIQRTPQAIRARNDHFIGIARRDRRVASKGRRESIAARFA